jgi:hypothetical protein
MVQLFWWMIKFFRVGRIAKQRFVLEFFVVVVQTGIEKEEEEKVIQLLLNKFDS